MHVPFVDLPQQCQQLREDVMAAVEDVVSGAGFILGKEVALFEEEFADYCGALHCVSVANGTEALHLALRALDVGPGDEVITVGNSFVATAFAISYTGATPVFVDVNPWDYTIDVDLVSEAITSRTKAILPVHLYGQPAEIAALKQLAAHHGLRIVEDACQAHGARWQERRVGTWGDAGCFSFYPGKNLGAFGDGGAVITDNADVAERLRMFRNYGQREKNMHTMLAYNSRLDTLQAAVLLVKLKHLDRWTAQRRAAAAAYGQLLADSPVELPHEKSHVEHVYHLFVVQHEQRDKLLHFLGARNVMCGIHYPVPLHQATPYKAARTVPHGLPVCSRLAGRILSLPLFPEITQEQIEHVAAVINAFELTEVRA